MNLKIYIDYGIRFNYSVFLSNNHLNLFVINGCNNLMFDYPKFSNLTFEIPIKAGCKLNKNFNLI